MKLKEFLLAILIAAGALRAQVGIGTKTPEGVLHVRAQTKNIQGESIQAALVLPTPNKAENVRNIQGREPDMGSLVFDQNKQCLRYFYLANKNDPGSGKWSECSGKDNIDKMMRDRPFYISKEGDLLGYDSCGRHLVYEVISSEKTKRKWLDRNIGAYRVAEHKNDELASGNLYQWGRKKDGHECEASETTNIRSGPIPEHNKFIILDYDNAYRPEHYNYKWQNIPNRDLWKMPHKLYNPCPVGFHVPSKEEWEAELTGFNSDDDAFNSSLKLVRWKFRNSRGKYSDLTYAYWSDDYHYMVMDGDKGEPAVQFFDGPESRSMDGMAIRCISDD